MLPVESEFPARSERKKMSAKAIVAAMLGALALTACGVPDWAKNGSSDVVLLMTAINGGSPLLVSVRPACSSLVDLRVENHFKNPNITSTGFRHDITVERYEVRYFRSDGRNTEGVDVPFRISGNLAQEIQQDAAATISLEVVRAQAKLEPPLTNLSRDGGAIVLTVFAEVTLHARTTTLQVTNPVSARLQIDFSDRSDFATTPVDSRATCIG